MKNKIRTRINALLISLSFIICHLSFSVALVSCSDYADYNEVPVDATAAGNQTLWENISQNPLLSDFAALVKRSGFDADLDNSHVYTVWAPVNGSFNPSDYASLTDEQLLFRFVKNHVAEYSHSASGQVEERVHTLNEKSYTFKGNSNYTFDGYDITQPNLPNINGLLHITNGVAQFYPNIYEFVEQAEGIDSLSKYFMSYETSTLDRNASVKGPVVGGEQTYIDSVIVTTNSILGRDRLNAKLDNEDSTYTFLMPTNDAFMEMYNKIKPLHNYVNEMKVLDVANFTKAGDSKEKTARTNATYLQDSLTRKIIVDNLVFSNNDGYNTWLTGNPTYLGTDTLRNTKGEKYSNPQELLAPTVSDNVMSNGHARIVDSLAFISWELYAPQISASPRNNLVGDLSVMSGNKQTIHVIDESSSVFGEESGITDFRFTEIYPKTESGKASAYIELPNVLSTTYRFYVVYLPWYCGTNDQRPTPLNFELSYSTARGATDSYKFSSKYLESGKASDANPKTLNLTTAFVNDPMKTDTVYIGEFTFPVAYQGLGSEYRPTIMLTSPVSTLNKTQMATYSRYYKILAILLKPVEFDEYEKSK